MKNCAVILASGRAIRMSGVDKMIISVAGKPLISFSIEAFLNCKKFDQIFITANDSNRDEIKEIVRRYSADEVVVISGGVRRQDSVKCALDMISNTNVVAIHDGARPLVSEKIIVEGFDLAIKHGSAVPVVPIEDTIKEAGGPSPTRIEGNDEYKWVLMDYAEFLVHVFDSNERDYYQLERLWSDRPLATFPPDEATNLR